MFSLFRTGFLAVLLGLAIQVSSASTTVLQEDFTQAEAGTDISEATGWTPSYFREEGEGWKWILVQSRSVACLSPGPEAGTVGGSITKSFPRIDGEKCTITVSVQAGFLKGTEDQAASSLGIALLNENGDGYAFVSRRNKGTYAYQYARISGADFTGANYVNVEGDSMQPGGLISEFKITRTPSGAWTFSKEEGAGDLKFDDTAVSSFDKVVLFSQAGAASFDFPPMFSNVLITTEP